MKKKIIHKTQCKCGNISIYYQGDEDILQLAGECTKCGHPTTTKLMFIKWKRIKGSTYFINKDGYLKTDKGKILIASTHKCVRVRMKTGEFKQFGRNALIKQTFKNI